MKTSIQQAERFVAMMGIEPIQSALNAGAQVVIAGRCSDVAIYAALPVLEGIPKHIAFTPEKFSNAVRRPLRSAFIRIAWRRNWIRMASQSIRRIPPFAAHHKASPRTTCMKIRIRST